MEPFSKMEAKKVNSSDILKDRGLTEIRTLMLLPHLEGSTHHSE